MGVFIQNIKTFACLVSSPETQHIRQWECHAFGMDKHCD